MDAELEGLLRDHETTTPDELLILIGEAISSESVLHSPQSLKAVGERFVNDLLGKIRSGICSNTEYANSDEVELAVAIATTINQNAHISVALLIGLYCSRRGIEWLCPDSSNNHSSRSDDRK